MNRSKTSRRVMTRAARRAIQARVQRSRRTRDQIVAVVSRGERWWRYVHEDDLTGVVREDVGAALTEFLADMFSREVPKSGNDVEAMYHAGFYLSAAWMIIHNTDAYDLVEVLDKHRIRIHHDWWITDGWGEWSEKFGTTCGECGTVTYAYCENPDTPPADVAWPERCVGCRTALPKPHHTDVYGGGTVWWANCSCGWETENSAKAQRYAKGQATRHLKLVAASETTGAALAVA